MPEAWPSRSEGVLNQCPKCPRSPKNQKKILNRGNELKGLLKSNGLEFFRQQNELVFERQQQCLKLRSKFQTAGKRGSIRPGSGVGKAPTGDERNSERVWNRRPECPTSPKNPKKTLNRGNELKDLLKPKGLAFFTQQNKLVFKRQKQPLKPKSTLQTNAKPSSRGPRLWHRGTSDERRAQLRIANGESRIQDFLARFRRGLRARRLLTTIKNEGTNRECY